MAFNRAQMQREAATLAAAGVFVGTSSWKYPGWLGRLYEPARYEWRGRFSSARFARNCLREYAEVFKTVCVDAAYYAFPGEALLAGLAAQTPADFQFAFKVTDEITVRRFPHLPRFGPRAGGRNPRFLDGERFATAFLRPCETIRARIGLLMFEFSRFGPEDYASGREFVADLDRFLGALPSGWPYAVELRNAAWLQPEYFACLARHRVAHVFNSWEAMPPVAEQMALPGSRPHPALVAARFLLRPGRRYAEAVRAFAPYEEIRDVYPEGRAAGAELIREGLQAGAGRKTFVFVNNRFEGNSLDTLAAMVAGR